MNNSNIWDNIATDYNFELSHYERELADELIKTFNELKISKQIDILEAGSGSGHLSALLAMKDYKVALLDFSKESLNKSKLFFKKYNLNAQFINANILKMPKSLSYDVVWNSGVMEHFKNKELLMAFQNLRKITGKYLIFIVPNKDSLPYLLYRFKLQKENKWKVGDEYLRKDYTPFLRAAGFDLLEKRYTGWEITKNFFEYYNPNDHGIFDKLVDNNFVPECNAYLIIYICSLTNDFRHLNLKGINDEKLTKFFNSLVKRFNAKK